MSEWLTTKKRGRDDAQIQRDSEQARTARRQQKMKKLHPPKQNGKIYQRCSVHKLDSLANKKKHHQREDDEEEDNWIVNSDEEEEEEEISWNGDDEEEEELLGEESNDFSSSEEDTSVPSHRRSKKPSQILKKKKFKEIARKRQKKMKPSSLSETIELSSDEDDDDDDLLASTWMSKQDNPKSPTKILEINDDSSSYESQTILFDENHAFPSKGKDTSNKNHQGGGVKDDKNQQGDSDDLTDTPREKAAIRKKPKKFKQAAAARSVHEKPSTKQAPSVLFELDNDSDMDSVEKANLEWALKQSVQTETTKKNFSKKVSTSDAAEDMSDSDRDDDEEGDEQDEYVDESARAASNILDTANQLSAQVLQTMAQWSQSAVSGMIVDGALALTQLNVGEIPTTDHTWISQDQMREILPKVELAEVSMDSLSTIFGLCLRRIKVDVAKTRLFIPSQYQLIGVNWLALLHSMKCGVIEGKSKSQMNVNGILADGMFIMSVLRFA